MIFPSPEERDAAADFLEAGSRRNAGLARVEAGLGTLGLLLSDPTLDEEIVLRAGGEARRSVVVRARIELLGRVEAAGS